MNEGYYMNISKADRKRFLKLIERRYAGMAKDFLDGVFDDRHLNSVLSVLLLVYEYAFFRGFNIRHFIFSLNLRSIYCHNILT